MIKWFTGEGKTGGDRYFLMIGEILSEKYEVQIEECFPIKIKGHPRLFSIIAIPASIVCINIRSLKLLKNGSQVCTLYYSGSIYIMAPPISKEISLRFKSLFKYYALVDYISRFGKNNIRIVIYISKFVKENYKFKKKGIKEYVIYPTVIKDIPPANYSEKENIIITVSRISEEKKLLRLINILDGLPFEHYLIGFPTDKLYFEKLKNVLKHTKFILDATEDTKYEYLKRAKIFINTSENEPFGLVIIEAMAFGAVPIAHKSGGPAEILPKDFLYIDDQEARSLILKYMAEYNEGIFNMLREQARKFTTQKMKEELFRAIDETFGND